MYSFAFSLLVITIDVVKSTHTCCYNPWNCPLTWVKSFTGKNTYLESAGAVDLCCPSGGTIYIGYGSSDTPAEICGCGTTTTWTAQNCPYTASQASPCVIDGYSTCDVSYVNGKCAINHGNGEYQFVPQDCPATPVPTPVPTPITKTTLDNYKIASDCDADTNVYCGYYIGPNYKTIENCEYSCEAISLCNYFSYASGGDTGWCNLYSSYDSLTYNYQFTSVSYKGPFPSRYPPAADPSSYPTPSPTPAPSPSPTAKPIYPTPQATTSHTGCNVYDETYLGDLYCDTSGGYNTLECDWDGGDCCIASNPGLSSNGDCLNPMYSDSDNNQDNNQNYTSHRKTHVLIAIIVVVVVLLLFIAFCVVWRKYKKPKQAIIDTDYIQLDDDNDDEL